MNETLSAHVPSQYLYTIFQKSFFPYEKTLNKLLPRFPGKYNLTVFPFSIILPFKVAAIWTVTTLAYMPGALELLSPSYLQTMHFSRLYIPLSRTKSYTFVVYWIITKWVTQLHDLLSFVGEKWHPLLLSAQIKHPKNFVTTRLNNKGFVDPKFSVHSKLVLSAQILLSETFRKTVLQPEKVFINF